MACEQAMPREIQVGIKTPGHRPDGGKFVGYAVSVPSMMPPMRRWVWNITAGVSLLLFVAAGVMWVRSYWIGDRIQNVGRGRMWVIMSNSGYVFMGRFLSFSYSEDPQWGYLGDAPFDVVASFDSTVRVA